MDDYGNYIPLTYVLRGFCCGPTGFWDSPGTAMWDAISQEWRD